MRYRTGGVLALLLTVQGCGQDRRAAEANLEAATPATEPISVSAGEWDARLAAEELEQGRQDPSWRRVVHFDEGAVNGASENTETFEDISPESVNSGPMHLLLHGDVRGPSVVRVQILLDRALFSPGIIDGHWGKNTEKALYWFQHRHGLPRTGRVDQATFERLARAAADSDALIREQTLTDDDVAGPFVNIPDDIYEKARLDCLCYESLTEKLGERFHTSPAMLAQLNPGVDLNALEAGDRIQVLDVRDPDAGRGLNVAKLVVSGEGFYVHALDEAGQILFHFPSTLGSTFDPSPTGDHTVRSITKDPWWHYQPAILAHVDNDEPDAKIPPGPNNAVGLVWMGLSIPHYGIHGTSAPETIGYTTSAGCVRLTNWDALFLADRVNRGVSVEFRNTGAAA